MAHKHIRTGFACVTPAFALLFSYAEDSSGYFPLIAVAQRAYCCQTNNVPQGYQHRMNQGCSLVYLCSPSTPGYYEVNAWCTWTGIENLHWEHNVDWTVTWIGTFTALCFSCSVTCRLAISVSRACKTVCSSLWIEFDSFSLHFAGTNRIFLEHLFLWSTIRVSAPLGDVTASTDVWFLSALLTCFLLCVTSAVHQCK